VVLPTGKVLMWGRPPIDSTDGTRANTTPAMLWDPAHPELPPEDVTPKLDLDGDGDLEDAPVFCSGQSLLPDGRVFAAGGTLAYPDYQAGGDFKGLDIAFLFDPWAETWSIAGRMRHGRWYPSQVELADGRIAIYAGLDETGSAADNRDLEIFDWRDGSLRHVPAGDAVPGLFPWFPFYPHLFTMPGGDVLLGGPDSIQSALLDTAALDGAGADGSAWTTIGGGKDGYGGLTTYYRGYGAGVILPNAPTRAALIGGYVDQDGDKRSQRDADVIDVAAATPRWSASPDVPPMNVGRANANVVILPDSSLVAVGGGAGFEPGGVTAGGDPAADPGTQNAYTGRDQELKRVELLRPGTDTAWRLGPAQAKWRTYHSTAVLLPDGRVLSAGDDYWDVGDVPDPWAATGATADEAEIYSPPYLFDGDGPAPRPAIGAAPANAPYGDVAGIPITAREAERVVLVAPAATTHANDMNQRLVELAIVSRVAGKGVNVRLPADGTLAPPGYYMLFAIDDAGTPSTAHWIRLGADAPGVPELTVDPVPSPDPEPTTEPDPEPTADPTADPTTDPAPTATPAPAPVVTVPPPPADVRAPRLRQSWGTVRRDTRALRISLRADEVARARLTVRARGRWLRRTATLVANRTRRLSLALPRGLVRRLRSGRRVRFHVAALASDGAGNRVRVTRRYRSH
jgi:hypothetical protein